MTKKRIDESWVCDKPIWKSTEILFRLFPSLQCHPRTDEEYAKKFLLKNRATIKSFAATFKIPVELFAAILYTEMTWSRLGAEESSAISYFKSISLGTKSSIGPGQVSTEHLMRWNPEMTLEEAAGGLYYRQELALASSARYISELYYELKTHRLPASPMRILKGSAVTVFTDKEKTLWVDVAERYNSKTGNTFYRRAFVYSLKEISAFF